MGTELQTIDPNRKTRLSVLSSEPKLAKLVETAPGFSHICSPDERAALAALIPEMEAALRPASRQGCRRAIGKLALAFHGAKLSDDEAEARLDLYADALADVPSDVLGEACMAIVRQSRFFPTPSEIREKCGTMARRQWELSKVRSLIATHDRMWRPEGEPLGANERARLAKLAARMDFATAIA